MKPYFSRGVSFRVEIMERGMNDTGFGGGVSVCELWKGGRAGGGEDIYRKIVG